MCTSLIFCSTKCASKLFKSAGFSRSNGIAGKWQAPNGLMRAVYPLLQPIIGTEKNIVLFEKCWKNSQSFLRRSVWVHGLVGVPLWGCANSLSATEPLIPWSIKNIILCKMRRWRIRQWALPYLLLLYDTLMKQHVIKNEGAISPKTARKWQPV